LIINHLEIRTAKSKFLVGAVLLALIALFSSCEDTPTTSLPDYGTQSDSARFYFLKGWQEILDYGRWTASGAAFRKAVEFDPDWLLGKSLVGRITRDLEEREMLLAELEAQKHLADPDEAMLLEVNMFSMQAANNRGRGIENSPEFNAMRRQLAEKNFGAFARKYPEDDYFKAEYIEFLHANHGAQVALDSIKVLANYRQSKLLFYITYAGSLEMELGDIEAAKAKLSDVFKGAWSDYLSPLVYQAQLWESQDSLVRAKKGIDQVVQLDSNHMIAVGMQARLAKLLESR